MEKIEKLKSFLVSSPDDSFLKHALALEYVKMGRDDLARALFEGILNRDPTYIGSYYHLGRLLERLGEKENAKSWLEKGLVASKLAGDQHAQRELQAAYEDLID